MWLICVILYIILAVVFTQSYKIVTKTSKNGGSLTVLLQVLAGICTLIVSIVFGIFSGFSFPSDWKIYALLAVACVFYAISDRLNTSVRSGIEASTFSIIKQLSTVFMIGAGLLFFHEEFIWQKILGAALIILSNVIIFYHKGKQKLNKYIALGIISNITLSIALFLDVNISEHFNLAFYVAITLLVPALFITIAEQVKPSEVKEELVNGNRKYIFLTSICWGLMIIAQLLSYQLGEVTVVAPLCALTVIGNVIVGWIFLKERDHLPKKIIAAVMIIISIILINL